MNSNYVIELAKQIALFSETLNDEGMREDLVKHYCDQYIAVVLGLVSMSER